MSGSDEAGDFGGSDPRLLLERNWNEADFRWERLTEAALGCWLGGQREVAAKGWSEALLLARQNFRPDDPRLAASLTAAACTRIADGERALAEKLLREALVVWDRAPGASASAGPQMAGERRSRSSTYHFSLESRFAGGYDRHVEARHAALLATGREGSLAWLHGRACPVRLAKWRKERPEGLTYSRKLMAAAYLLPPNNSEA